MEPNEKRDLLYVAIGLGTAIAATLLVKGGGSVVPAGTAAPASKQQLDFALSSAQEENNFTLARSNAALAAITTLAQNKTNAELGLAGIQSQTRIAFKNAQTQEDIAGIQAGSAKDVATLQAQAQIGVAQVNEQGVEANAAATKAAAEANARAQVDVANAQKPTFWQSLFGAASNIFKVKI